MKKSRTILTLFMLLAVYSSNAQLSKSTADNLVMNMLGTDYAGVVYGMTGSIGDGVSVFTADGVEMINPYNDSYVYFIDDLPAANWAHPCRYCFVNTVNGSYSIVNQKFCPLNNDSFERIGEASNGNNNWCWPYTSYTIPNKATPNGKLYAVIIGGDPITHDPLKIWYDLSCVYTALVNSYGFKEASESDNNHIIVSAHGDVYYMINHYYGTNNLYDLNQSRGVYDSDDFFYDISYSKDGIKEIFDNLSGTHNTSNKIPELSYEDQLFVCLCGHGNIDNGRSYFKLNYNHNTNEDIRLYDDELASWVRDIKCSQMTFLIDCCYSGGFIDNLMNDSSAECINRVVTTATDESHPGYVEQHITSKLNRDSNGGEKIDEFVYYWTAASLGYYPILEKLTDSLLGPWHKYDNTSFGQFPWQLFTSFNEGNGNSHVVYDVNPDTNLDGVVSMNEAYVFADNLDSYSPNGYYNPYNSCDTCIEVPQSSYESTFTKELITLDGYKGIIYNDAQTGIKNKYILDGNVIVWNNASLIINDSCIFEGNNHYIENRGVLSTASDNYDVTFRKTQLVNNAGYRFSLSNCLFDTCGLVLTYDGYCTINESIFNETLFEANTNNPVRDNYCVNIIGNTFNNSINDNSIYLRKVPECNVIGNVVTSGGNGIYINHLDGSYHNYNFLGNDICFCGGTGFVSYHSNGKLSGNNMRNNVNGGFKSLNLGNMYIKGDSTSSIITAQKIHDNRRYQIYASMDSYPVDFHYNALYGSDTILFYESNSMPCKSFDVTKNYWSNLGNNEVASHLYTNGNRTFNYMPTWEPQLPYVPPTPPERLLLIGDSLVGTGDYTNASNMYKNIISLYSESSEAIVSLKALFAVEVVANGDFADLKNYYITLLHDENLCDVADKLANRCDVKMHNYEDAILWYENKIADSNTLFSDRIFAEIDLGDLYLEMTDMDKQSITGMMTEYIPVSDEAHDKHTNHLLCMLPGKYVDNTNIVGSELQNHVSVTSDCICYPNPAKYDLAISYGLESKASVEIIITDVLGNDIRHIWLGIQNRGNHNVDIDISELSEGFYFCNILTDNGMKDSQKIIIAR